MYGERANFTRLVPGGIDADFTDCVLVEMPKALAEICTAHSLLELSNLKLLFKRVLLMLIEIHPELFVDFPRNSHRRSAKLLA